MLLLLEGQKLHIPAPKSHFAKDIFFDKDTPIFATVDEPIQYEGRSKNVEVEQEMMDNRWKIFTFSKQISKAERIEQEICTVCFAKMVLHGVE